MKNGRISRRDYLAMLGTGATALAASGMRLRAADAVGGVRPTGESSAEERADRERRMKWWHAAKFGMFIHWGLYSVYGHHEWAMEEEGIPVAEYEQFALKGLPGASRHPRLITSGSRRTRKKSCHFLSSEAPLGRITPYS
jgi:alpha-L-fucosidase